MAKIDKEYKRDKICLRWVGEQYAVSLDHLQILFSRESARKYQMTRELMFINGAQKIVDRWYKNGWVEARKILTYQPKWIWLKRKGYKIAELKYPYREPSPGFLDHHWHTNAVRLHVEASEGNAIQWISERQLAKEFGGKKKHVADGAIVSQFEHKTIALEVELNRKSKRRWKLIMQRVKRDHDAVWYFTKDKIYTALQTAAKQADADQGKIKVYRFDKLLKNGEYATNIS